MKQHPTIPKENIYYVPYNSYDDKKKELNNLQKKAVSIIEKADKWKEVLIVDDNKGDYKHLLMIVVDNRQERDYYLKSNKITIKDIIYSIAKVIK